MWRVDNQNPAVYGGSINEFAEKGYHRLFCIKPKFRYRTWSNLGWQRGRVMASSGAARVAGSSNVVTE